MKSPNNKTIDTPLEEGKAFLEFCSCPSGDISADIAKNAYFNTDFFDICERLPEKFFDLIIADPPYNLRKDYAGDVFSRKSESEYEEFTRKWLFSVKKLLKDNGSLYVCCDWQTGIIIGRVLSDYFIIRNRITWQREKGRGAKSNWKNSMEDIWFCTASDNYKFNLDAVKVRKKVIAPYRANGKPKDWEETDSGRYRNTCPSNFWDDITVPFWSMDENTAHPTQKPEKLIAKLILASSDEGDMIFDPFAGSGTTAVTAKKLGRNFTCVEKNPQFCVWAQIRMQKAERDNKIQGYENGVFIGRNEKFPVKNCK